MNKKVAGFKSNPHDVVVVYEDMSEEVLGGVQSLNFTSTGGESSLSVVPIPGEEVACMSSVKFIQDAYHGWMELDLDIKLRFVS